jgi:polysaccharide export outer membrane protein
MYLRGAQAPKFWRKKFYKMIQMPFRRRSASLLITTAISILCFSCSTNKKVIYFQDIQNTKESEILNSSTFIEPLIHPNDNLSVNIFTLNQETGAIINQAASTPVLGGNAGATMAQQSSSFVVDKNGDIELALAGRIKVSGLTTYQARELVRAKVLKFYNEPNVQLRFANFKISVIGEVNSPSSYIMPTEKVSIMDAISIAGDLTIYGRRDNVLVVRDNDGKKEYAHLDLNSTSIFKSSFYYLRQNDLIYVEPNRAKNAANNAERVQTISIITSVLSVLILAISVLK